MTFLHHLGFDQETVGLVLPHAVIGKDSAYFPFSSAHDGETLYIDRTVRRAARGLFVLDPGPDGVKSAAYYFASVHDLMCLYQRGNRPALQNALLVVVSLIIEKKHFDHLREGYPTIVRHYIAVPDDIARVKIAAALSGKDVRVSVRNESVIVGDSVRERTYHRFVFSRYARDFKIPPNIRTTKNTKNWP